MRFIDSERHDEFHIQRDQDEPEPLPISGWEDFLREGEAFLKIGAHARGRKAFTPEIEFLENS